MRIRDLDHGRDRSDRDTLHFYPLWRRLSITALGTCIDARKQEKAKEMTNIFGATLMYYLTDCF